MDDKEHDVTAERQTKPLQPDGTGKRASQGRKTLSTPTLAVIALVLVLGLAILLFFTLSTNKALEKDKNIVAGSVEGMTMDEIQKVLDDAVEASKVTTSVTSVVDVDSATKEAQWLLGNPDSNTKELRATVTVNDTGQVIYQSGIIKPGYFIPKAPITTDLAQGGYECTVTFEVIDPDSNLIVGTTATEILVRVK